MRANNEKNEDNQVEVHLTTAECCRSLGGAKKYEFWRAERKEEKKEGKTGRSN